MSVWVTGDIHGDISRFRTDVFPEQICMDKESDYVIILGDFGVIWSNAEYSKSENELLDKLENKSFTTLFIDGNHENFDRLYKYPVKEWHGGKVHEIRPSVIHLMRGQIFNIEGKDFFAFGGARSHDIRDGVLDPVVDREKIEEWTYDRSKLFRVRGKSWWDLEMPTDDEMRDGVHNLIDHGNKVDYILTHCPYTSLLKQMCRFPGAFKEDKLTDYFQMIKNNIEYKQWLFGHMHANENFYHEKSVCIYEQLVRLL